MADEQAPNPATTETHNGCILVGREKARCESCECLSATCKLEPRYSDRGTCYKLSCWNMSCHKTVWYVCIDCDKRLGRTSADYHFNSATHRRAVESNGELTAAGPLIVSPALPQKRCRYDTLANEAHSIGNNKDQQDEVHSNSNYCVDDEASSTTLHQGNGDSDFPFFPRRGLGLVDTWCATMHRWKEAATNEDINRAFEGMENMQLYFAAEQATPPGHFGGGLSYLIARAFQKTKYIKRSMLRSFDETVYHFISFIQYRSMSDKQRDRQGFLSKAGYGNPLFLSTGPVKYCDMPQYYGNSGPHSIGTTIPIPRVQNFSGVAYISPIDIVKYCFAHGVKMDDMFVHCNGLKSLGRRDRVLHVEDCEAACRVQDQVLSANNPSGKLIMVPWASVWRDGFSASRTKHNRKSVVPMTLTIGTPKESINSVDNTFLTALGLKTSKIGWTEAEYQFQKDVDRASDPKTPIYTFHGGLKKMVWVSLQPLTFMEDRVERGDATYTLSHASDYHRCFGKSLKVNNTVIDIPNAELFLSNQKAGIADHLIRWGWSHEFVITEANNGGRIGSCWICRRMRLLRLGVRPPSDKATTLEDLVCEGMQCVDKKMCCADWCLGNKESLDLLGWPSPPDYPMWEHPNCVLNAPAGRKPGLTELYPVDLSFPFLVQATKYAFFHCSRERASECWNQKTCLEYLRTCGVSTKIQRDIYDAAKNSRGSDDEVDYNSPVGLGDFKYPAPWIGKNTLQSHIEMVMHLVFLGVSQSNFSLIDAWLKQHDLGVNTFRKGCQALLRDVGKLNLSWCMALPFNGAESKLGTGSWVSENWLAWTRLSKIVYSWIIKDLLRSARLGGHDVCRLIQSFLAMVARLMTHSGVEMEDIDAIEEYIKEFMSCVMEFDIQVNFKKIGKKRNEGAQSVANKRTEPFWTKSNYISLFNLAPMIRLYGPVVLWWDGGGKGEKFIPLCKIKIPRGVRDSSGFMPKLAENIYQEDSTSRIEKEVAMYQDKEDDQRWTMDSFEELPEELPFKPFGAEDGYQSDESEDLYQVNLEAGDSADDIDSDEDESSEESIGEPEQRQAHDGLAWEDFLMSKARTIRVYRTRLQVEEDIENLKPIAGILVEHFDQARKCWMFHFCVPYRIPRKRFQCALLDFDDSDGVSVNGSWYAPIDDQGLRDGGNEIQYSSIEEFAKSSCIAIPLRYIEGDASTNANKYCVITNWWRERVCGGEYELPRLDPWLYEM